jgi:hypothetical protein
LTPLTDHDRIREMINRLDELQRESEAIRRRIVEVGGRSAEFPPRTTADIFATVGRECADGDGRSE